MNLKKITIILTAVFAMAAGLCFAACGGGGVPDDANAPGPGIFRFEAEEAELFTPEHNANFIKPEANASASGQACVIFFGEEGNSVTFNFTSTADETGVTLNLCASSCLDVYENGERTGERAIPGAYFRHIVKTNGSVPAAFTGHLNGSGSANPNFELGYHNWSVVTTSVDLKKGDNIITLVSPGVAINWDYVELTTVTAGLTFKAVNNF